MLREATINDVSSIAEIIVKAWQAAYEGIIDPNYSQTLSKDKYVKIFNNNIWNNLEKIMVFEILIIFIFVVLYSKEEKYYDKERFDKLTQYDYDHMLKDD